MGGGAWLQRRADSDLGRSALRFKASCGESQVLRRDSSHSAGKRRGVDGPFHAPTRTVGGGASCLRRGVRRLRTGIRAGKSFRAAGLGRGTTFVCGESFGEFGSEGARDVFGRAGLALRLSVAAASTRAD